MTRKAIPIVQRWTAVSAIVLALIFTAVPALCSPLRLKVGTLAPDSTPWMDNLYSYLHGIEELSPQPLNFVTYPGGVMGDEPDLVRKLKFDQLQVVAVTVSGLAKLVPEVLVLSLPFLFNSYDEVDYVTEHLMPDFKKAARKRGFVILGLGDNGWVNIYSKNRFTSVAELQRQKVWVWNGNPLELAQTRALGIKGHPVGVPEVLIGLQTGLLNTVMTSSTGVVALQWHTELKYQYPIHLRYEPGGLIASAKALNHIPADKRAAFDRVNDAMVKKWFVPFRKQNRDYQSEMTKLMQESGVARVRWPREEVDRMKAMTRPVWTESVGKLFPQELLDRVLHSLDEYRQQHQPRPGR